MIPRAGAKYEQSPEAGTIDLDLQGCQAERVNEAERVNDLTA